MDSNEQIRVEAYNGNQFYIGDVRFRKNVVDNVEVFTNRDIWMNPDRLAYKVVKDWPGRDHAIVEIYVPESKLADMNDDLESPSDEALAELEKELDDWDDLK